MATACDLVLGRCCFGVHGINDDVELPQQETAESQGRMTCTWRTAVVMLNQRTGGSWQDVIGSNIESASMINVRHDRLRWRRKGHAEQNKPLIRVRSRIVVQRRCSRVATLKKNARISMSCRRHNAAKNMGAEQRELRPTLCPDCPHRGKLRTY